MALTKIDDIYFYNGITDTAQKTWEMKKYLIDNNIAFINMQYGDDSQFEDVFSSLSSWFNIDIINFPILTYTEVHDDLPPSQYPKKCLLSVEELISNNFIDLYKIGR